MNTDVIDGKYIWYKAKIFNKAFKSCSYAYPTKLVIYYIYEKNFT